MPDLYAASAAQRVVKSETRSVSDDKISAQRSASIYFVNGLEWIGVSVLASQAWMSCGLEWVCDVVRNPAGDTKLLVGLDSDRHC